MFHSLQEHVAWYELTQLARSLPKKQNNTNKNNTKRGKKVLNI